MVVGQSTLDGSLLLGPTGWRVSSVARQEAKTANGEGQEGERELETAKSCGGESRAWLAGQREAEAERMGE